MKSRIFSLQQSLDANAMLIENPVDLLYLTGLSLSRGIFVLTREESVLFVDGRYFAKAEKESPCPVRLLEDGALFQWLEARSVRTLVFDSAFTSCDRFEALENEANTIHLVPSSVLLKQQRVFKSDLEIQALTKAATLTRLGIQFIEGLLKVGITEEELAFEFECFVRKNGASHLSFDPIIAFGEHSAYPHYRAGKTSLQNNQIVLIDAGAVVDHYAGDCTRVVFFGAPELQLMQYLKLVQEAQQKAMDLVRPGVALKELDLAARSVFQQAGVEELFTHGLGHGIGLETHEFPSVRAKGPDRDVLLKPGMTFTIEPGLYKPGLGGVRWEDVFLVTEDGWIRI